MQALDKPAHILPFPGHAEQFDEMLILKRFGQNAAGTI
jgi:hypothetical protein